MECDPAAAAGSAGAAGGTCVDLAALNCSWYLSDALIRDPQVTDYCLQKLARDSEPRPLGASETSAVLVAIYALAVLATLGCVAGTAWWRARRGAAGAGTGGFGGEPFEVAAGPVPPPACPPTGLCGGRLAALLKRVASRGGRGRGTAPNTAAKSASNSAPSSTTETVTQMEPGIDGEGGGRDAYDVSGSRDGSVGTASELDAASDYGDSGVCAEGAGPGAAVAAGAGECVPVGAAVPAVAAAARARGTGAPV